MSWNVTPIKSTRFPSLFDAFHHSVNTTQKITRRYDSIINNNKDNFSLAYLLDSESVIMQKFILTILLLVCSVQAWLPALPRTAALVWRRRKVQALHALDLKVFTFPAQTDLSQYEQLLMQQIPEDKMIRWYVSKIKGDKAEIEVVFENSPTDTSG